MPAIKDLLKIVNKNSEAHDPLAAIAPIIISSNNNILEKDRFSFKRREPLPDIDNLTTIQLTTEEVELLALLKVNPFRISVLPFDNYEAIGVDQGQMATVTGSERFVETVGMWPCIGLCIYKDTPEAPVCMAHIDSGTTCIRRTLDKIIKDLGSDNLKAVIVGANDGAVETLTNAAIAVLLRYLKQDDIPVEFIRVLQKPSENDSLVFDRHTKKAYQVPRSHRFQITDTTTSIVDRMKHHGSYGALKAYDSNETPIIDIFKEILPK